MTCLKSIFWILCRVKIHQKTSVFPRPYLAENEQEEKEITKKTYKVRYDSMEIGARTYGSFHWNMITMGKENNKDEVLNCLIIRGLQLDMVTIQTKEILVQKHFKMEGITSVIDQ